VVGAIEEVVDEFVLCNWQQVALVIDPLACLQQAGV
jgi:hypothetical protein